MQREKNLWLKVLSMILTLTLLISCVPSQVYAMAGEAMADLLEQERTAESIETPNETKRGVYEVTELREANVKHFALEDGTYTAVMYGNVVHTQDAEGNWQDIDNRLSDSGSEFATSNARVKFAKKITGSKTLFTLHDGNRKITMSLDNATNKTAGVVTNHMTEFDSEATQLQKLMTLDNLSSEILYANILDGVDLQYVVESLNVKENIIVRERKESYQYTFTIILNNLEAEMVEDGSVRIYDPGTLETVYNIPAGFMYDANGEYSTAVTYTLTDNSNGKYSLCVAANSAWINAEGRALPVVIDPTITQPSSTSFEATFIHPSTPNAVGSGLGYYAAGTLGIAYWKTNSLPTLPAGYYITDASFVADRSEVTGTPVTSYDLELGIYKVFTDWDADTFCYSQYDVQGAGQYIEHAIDIQNGENEDHQYIWNITQIVRDWYDMPSSNYGVAIRCPNALTTDLLYRFSYSRKCMPICITYKSVRGLEDYWSYAKQSAGRAGTGYINKATGELTFAIGTLSTTDALFGHTTTLVYNQAHAGQYVVSATANIPTVNPTCGYGIKINVNESLIERNYVDAIGDVKTYYIWTDADGTEHEFYPVSGSSTVYKDSDGLLLTLTVTNNVYEIKDMNHNIRTFTRDSIDRAKVQGGAILQSITDKNGNKLNYIYLDDGKVSKIQVIPNGGTAITYLEFHYNSYGQVNQVNNYGLPSAPKVKFYYSPGYSETTDISSSYHGYLKKIEFINDNEVVATTSYEYDSSGKLIAAHDDTFGYSVEYAYSGNRIASITEYAGTADTQGQTISLVYRDGYTEIRSSGSDDRHGTDDDLISVYIFDEYGRVTSTYTTDATRTIIYGASSGEYEEQENVKNNLKTSVSVGGASSNYLYNGGFESYRYRSTLAYNQALGWSHLPNVTIVNYADQITKTSSATGEHCYAYFDLEHNSQHTLYQDVTLPAGQYTLSFDLQCFYTLNVDATVKVVSLSDATRTFEKSIPLDDYDASQGSMTISMNFEAIDYNNTGCEEVRILFAVECGSLYDPTNSYITVDNVMLEENIGCSGYSVVEFGNFEDFSDESSYKTHWGSTATTVYDSELLGNVLVVNPGQMFTQTIYSADATQATIGTRTYTISGMAKGTNQYASGDFRIKAIVEYHDSSEQDIINFDFQYNSTEWQFVCRNFTTRSGLKVKTIQLCLEYNNNPGVAYFDNIYATQVISDTTVTTEYYDDGLVQVRKNGYYTEVYEYDENNNLIRLANNRGQIYDYTYTETNDIATSTYYTFVNSLDNTLVYPYQYVSPDNYITKIPVTQSIYTYNTYGQLTKQITFEVEYSSVGAASQEIVKKADTQYVTTEYGYYITAGCRIFGALAYSVDNSGVETRYYMDEETGYLFMVVNAETRTGTYYTYDAIGNIKTVTPATYSAGEFVSVDDAQKVEYTYNSVNQLDTITTRSTQYKFNYDVFGKTDSILVGSNQIVSYEYNDRNGKMTAIHYANRDTIRYVYDELENVSEVWYADNDPETEDIQLYAYSYNAYGQLYRFDNLVSKQSIIYEYDANKRMIGFVEFDTETMSNSLSAAMKYNDKSQIEKVDFSMDYLYRLDRPSGERLTYFYYYNNDGSLSFTRFTGGSSDADTTLIPAEGTTTYTYDVFNRLNQKVYEYNADYERPLPYQTQRKWFTNTIQYKYLDAGNDNTTLYVREYTSQINSYDELTYTYDYDANGNITKVALSTGEECRYKYDDMGQLLREDNTVLGKTYVYEYDNAGNITKKYTYALTAANATPQNPEETYVYGYDDSNWGDKLTSYRGYSFDYDEIGNPKEYYNGREYRFTWENGRRLATASVDGVTLTFTYNADGIRTSKKVGNTEHVYHLNGSQIITETWGETVIIYLYDAEGSPIGMKYRGGNMAAGVFEEYWFEKNLQGDIVAVYDAAGNKHVSYNYDAWGNVTTIYHDSYTATSHADLNPFRYRGYYYDAELGMYYLQSRYYDPVIGRFINADGVAYLGADGTLLAYNLFAYCGNNPVMGYDPAGNVNWSLIGKIALTTVVVAACLTGVGALAAAAATATAVSVSAAVTTAVVTAGISTVCAAVDGGICAVESGGDFADGFMAGAIGGSLGALVSNATNPVPQTDGAYRMNLLGRAASSLTYDVTYDWFSGKLNAQNVRECMQTYSLDIPLDVIGSIVYYDYTELFNTGFVGSCIGSAVNGIIDAIIDVVQVEVLFS